MADKESPPGSNQFSQTFGIEWADSISDSTAPPMILRLSEKNARVVVGRADACTVCVMDPLLSRQHFEVAFAEGNWAARDLGSRNGTVLNGETLGTEPRQVSAGDVIEAGTSGFQILFNRE